MRVDRPRNRMIMRHPIWARSVYRYAVRDSRSPGGVSAGIEIGSKLHRRETPVAGRADPGDDPRGMALGRRHDRFAARINHADRPIELPSSDRDEGLDRQIELRAEAAADRRRNDANLPGRDAENRRNAVAIHIGGLRTGLDLDTIADAASETRLGLDVRVLDETCLEDAFDDDVRRGKGRRSVAARHTSAGQDVAGAMRVNAFGALFERLVDRRQSRARGPGHGKGREIEMAHRLGVPDHKRHRLAAKACEALREHGLVRESRDHPVAVHAEHILCGEDSDDPRMSALERVNVADSKCGVRVRRSYRPRLERLRRPFVRAEDFCSRELADPVDAGNPTANRGLRRRFHYIRDVEEMRVPHGVEDGAIARAAAQHAAESVLDRLFIRPRLSSQQSDRGQQNAGRADAALRGAMDVKGRTKLSDNRLIVAETLDRFDSTSVHLPNASQARADRLTVDEHRTGAAIAGLTAYLDANEAEFLAQRMAEAIERRSGHSRRLAIEAERDAGRAFEHQTTPPVRSSMQASIARLSKVKAASRR